MYSMAGNYLEVQNFWASHPQKDQGDDYFDDCEEVAESVNDYAARSLVAQAMALAKAKANAEEVELLMRKEPIKPESVVSGAAKGAKKESPPLKSAMKKAVQKDHEPAGVRKAKKRVMIDEVSVARYGFAKGSEIGTEWIIVDEPSK